MEKRRVRELLFVIAVLWGAAILPLSYAAYFIYSWCVEPFSKEGPVTSPADFPKPLQDLLHEAEQKRIQIEQLEVYCWADFGDQEYYFQMRSSGDLVDLITKRWELSPVKQTHEGLVSYFWQRIPPSWEIPARPPDSDIFVGLGVVVLHDKAQQRLVVRYTFDF